MLLGTFLSSTAVGVLSVFPLRSLDPLEAARPTSLRRDESNQRWYFQHGSYLHFKYPGVYLVRRTASLWHTEPSHRSKTLHGFLAQYIFIISSQYWNAT